MYSEQILKHFKNPHNVGKVVKPSGMGSAENADIIEISLKIENEIIIDAKFKAFGSIAIIAVGSILTDYIKKMHVNDAAGIDEKEILNLIGELESDKQYTITLAKTALNLAITNHIKQLKKSKTT